MKVCATCKGKGALEPTNSGRPKPAYWFQHGARTCPSCDGTGEAD